MRNFGLMAATLAVGIAFGGAALAAPSATVLDHSTNGVGNDAWDYGGGYSGWTPTTGYTWNSDPTVVPPPGNLSGVYQSPFNNTALSETRSYFSTGAQDGANGSPSPLELFFANPIEAFSILWGSIDNYNTISFFDVHAVQLFQLTGAGLMALIDPLLVNPNPSHNYEHVALVNFKDLGGAVRAVFESGQNGGQTPAFEFALAVPVPAALPLFGCAIGGLVLLRARRTKRASGSPVLA